MELSPRTVEHYIENIKQKLNVTSKSELIEKVVQELWPEMLF
ncbi:MAG: response regulator transcription factor [Legionella sp.]|nr:response regulator transcription factor [Legionella sp.]